MGRRLLMTALIGILAFSLSWSAVAPAGPARSEDHRQPGLAGCVDTPFISAQKHQLTASVDDVLSTTCERKTEFHSNVEQFTCTTPRIATIVQSRQLRI